MSKIDVSKCEFYTNVAGCGLADCVSKGYKTITNFKCKYNNCYYKILQREKQNAQDTYEMWKASIESITIANKQLYEAREENKQLEFKYNMLAKQYAKLQEQYQKVLKLVKENADSNEYCLRELERDYEKATQKLVELGVYNV